MAGIALFFQRPKGTQILRTVGAVTAPTILDATLKETLTGTAELTKHPVEKGADIGDNVVLHPKKLSISGIITETPLGNFLSEYTKTAGASVGSALGSKLGAFGGAAGAVAGGIGASSLAGALFGSKDRVLANVAKELESIRTAKQPVNIQTGLDLYKNYIMTSFQISRDTKSGRSINCEFEFEEVIFVHNKLTLVKLPKIKGGIDGVNGGRHSTEEASADANTKGKSLLKQLFSKG